MSRIHIGIDPGKKGALVELVDGKIGNMFVTPLISKEYDEAGMRAIIEKYKVLLNNGEDVHIVLENVHSLGGVSAASNASLMDNAGFWRGLLVAYKIPFTRVSPKEWQKEVWTGIKPIYKTKKTETSKKQIDTKAMSLIAAQRLFPTANLLKSNRCIKPDEGFVDALLMAEYCRRKF